VPASAPEHPPSAPVVASPTGPGGESSELPQAISPQDEPHEHEHVTEDAGCCTWSAFGAYPVGQEGPAWSATLGKKAPIVHPAGDGTQV
jgi:hypothetical protein